MVGNHERALRYRGWMYGGIFKNSAQRRRQRHRYNTSGLYGQCDDQRHVGHSQQVND